MRRPMTERLMNGQETFDPHEAEKRLERLRRDGRLPSPEAMLEVLEEVREKYRPQLLKARKQAEDAAAEATEADAAASEADRVTPHEETR